MPSKKLPNYLRTYRKRSYLSQDEVAFLLGCESGANVSRYEKFSRLPKPETIFAYEILFKAPPRELFAGVFQKVEGVVSKRARLLARRISKAKPEPMRARKLDALRAVSSEAGTTKSS